MTERLPDLTQSEGEERATAYYVDRLATLERLARERSGPAFVLRAERLVEALEATLAELGRFLGLETPIATSYSTFPLTGVPVRGDFSAKIMGGRIQPRAKDEVQPPLRADLQAAESAPTPIASRYWTGSSLQVHDPALSRAAAAVLVLGAAPAAAPVLPPDPLQVLDLQHDQGKDPEKNRRPRHISKLADLRAARNGPPGSFSGAAWPTRLRRAGRRRP